MEGPAARLVAGTERWRCPGACSILDFRFLRPCRSVPSVSHNTGLVDFPRQSRDAAVHAFGGKRRVRERFHVVHHQRAAFGRVFRPRVVMDVGNIRAVGRICRKRVGARALGDGLRPFAIGVDHENLQPAVTGAGVQNLLAIGRPVWAGPAVDRRDRPAARSDRRSLLSPMRSIIGLSIPDPVRGSSGLRSANRRSSAVGPRGTHPSITGIARWIRPKETVAVEMDHVVGKIGDPNLRFPDNL